MCKFVPGGAFLVLGLLAGCGRPDSQALKKLACEQVANTIDLQSVSQLDTLRKALGLAPGVDPIGTCRALGVTMESRIQGESSGDSGTSGEAENRKTESSDGEN